MTTINREISGCFLLTVLLVSANVLGQESQSTDLTGKQVSVDQLVGALDIPTRGIGAKCGPHQEKMTRLTRGISSVPSTAAEVPDLKPVKSASVSVTFEKNSDVLTDESRSLLETIATAMNSSQLSAQCFQLAGHTCDLGDDSYNMSLSRRRADSAKAYLVDHGVDAERLVTTGFGEVSPMSPNDSDESRERNRRVDLGALAPAAMEY